LFVAFIGTTGATGACVEQRNLQGKVIHRAVFLCPGDSSEKSLLSQALQIYSKAPRTTPFSEIVVSASLAELQRSALRRLPDDAGFDQVRLLAMELAEESRSPLHSDGILRIFRRHDNAIATYREPGDPVRTAAGVHDTQIEGNVDGRVPLASDKSIRILSINETRNEIMPYALATVFARSTQGLDCDRCRAILQSVSPDLVPSGTDILIRMRDNVWFDGPGHAPIFRFEPDNLIDSRYARRGDLLTVPTAEGYYRSSAEVQCWYWIRSQTRGCALNGNWLEKTLKEQFAPRMKE
jgi:hypothetical protein